MKGLYETKTYVWLNDKLCDSCNYTRNIHYGEIPKNKVDKYTIDDLDILEELSKNDSLYSVWWRKPLFKKPTSFYDYNMYAKQNNNVVRLKWKDFKDLTIATHNELVDPASITLAELGKYLSVEECTNFLVDYVKENYKET